MYLYEREIIPTNRMKFTFVMILEKVNSTQCKNYLFINIISNVLEAIVQISKCIKAIVSLDFVTN